LPEAQRQLTRSVFLRMTELGDDIHDTRRRVSFEELVPDGAREDTVHALVERLAEARLVMLDETSAEVAHEALIREWPRLRGWLDEDRAGIRLHRQLSQAARLWEKAGREPTDVYRGARLAGAVELAQSSRVELNVAERAFLDASVAEGDRERRAQLRSNRRLRALLGASVLLLMIAIAAGVLSLVQRNHARSAESAARAQGLTSDAERVGALALSAPTLDQSLLLAVAGVKLQDRVETRGDLLAVFQHNAAAVRVVGVTQASLAAFALSPDGRLLTAGDGAGLVRFFDLRTLKPAGPSVRLPQPVSQQSIAFSPDGRTLAVGTRQGASAQLYFVDVAARRARRVGAWRGFATSGHPTTTLAYAPDGRLAIGLATDSPGSTGEVAQRLLLVDAGGRTVWQRRYPLRRGQSEAHLLFTPGGSLITSAPQGDTLVWDARSGQITRRFLIGGRPALAPDGRRLALALNSPDAGHPTSAIAILDLHNGRHTMLAGALPDEWILALAFTPDGKQIVGPAFNGTHVWDVGAGSIAETYPGTQRNGNNPGVVIDRRGLVLVVAGGGNIGVWDPNGSRRLARRLPSGCCAVFDARGTTMATSNLDGSFQLKDLRSVGLTQRLPADDGAVAAALGFTPDGRRLVTGGSNRTVTIWDLATRSVVRRLRYAEPVWAGAVSPDGNLVAVQRQSDGSQESRVEVRDLTSGRMLYTRAVRFGLGTVAFSRGGRELVASGCCNGGSTVTAWDAHTGARLFDRAPPVLATAFATAPVAQTLVIGTQDGRMMLWDARTGRQRGPATKVAGTPVVQVALSPDGHLIAAAARDGTTTLWDARSRKRIGDKFPVAPGWIPGVAFEPSGRLMIGDSPSGSSEWPADRPTLERFACAVAGREMTRAEWLGFLPARPFEHVCRAAA
jgi:WD40 repeat protein